MVSWVVFVALCVAPGRAACGVSQRGHSGAELGTSEGGTRGDFPLFVNEVFCGLGAGGLGIFPFSRAVSSGDGDAPASHAVILRIRFPVRRHSPQFTLTRSREKCHSPLVSSTWPPLRTGRLFSFGFIMHRDRAGPPTRYHGMRKMATKPLPMASVGA